MDYVRGSSTQCVLPADQTRITACRLQASVVTKIVANTTPIKQNKKKSTLKVDAFERNSDQTHQRKTFQNNTQKQKYFGGRVK